MPNKKQNTKSNKSRKSKRRQSRLKNDVYVRMLADPCGSELVPGIYGTTDGFTARFKSTINPSAGSGNPVAGYILWIPQLTNLGTPQTNGHFNLFGFAASNGTAAPVNTTTNPLGEDGEWAVAAGNSGFKIPDPASPFVSGDLCQVARMISACMRFTYTGRLTNSSGQIGFIENLDPWSLLQGGTSDGPPTVDQMFNLCRKVERVGLDTNEIRYSAYTDNDEVYHSITNSGWTYTAGNLTDVGATSSRFRYPAFGLCWRGLATDFSFVIDLIKNIEWKPEPMSGLMQPPSKHIPHPPRNSLLVWLDQNMPDWQSKTLSAAVSTVAAIAGAAQAGVMQRTRGPMLPR